MGLTYPSNKVCPRCGAAGYVWYAEYNMTSYEIWRIYNVKDRKRKKGR